MSDAPLGLVVLISGRGSNLQAIVDAITGGTLNAVIHAVISNDPQAPGLERAREVGAQALSVNHRDFPNRDAFDGALAAAIAGFSPDLIVLAGFMRVLGADFVNTYSGRLINIHPSLLPDFPGLDTHRRALESGVPEHGASVHYVTAELDGGPVIAQARVPVMAGDDENTLATRVLAREHVLLPGVLDLIARGRVELGPAGEVRLDDAPMNAPLRF